MTDRPKAQHTLEIIIEPTWKPTAYFKCHGDQNSACWWGIDSINLEAEKGSQAGLYFESTDDIREMARAMTAWADEQDGVEK
jgi:hypothetical protein